MLAMSGRKDVISQLLSLNLHTTACSYEWDPCDVFKAAELLARQQGGVYTKQPGEDMISIHAGICESKGGVHVTFNRLSTDVIERCRDLCDRELYACLASEIDRVIHQDYRLWPSNYAAADLQTGGDTYADCYTEDQKLYFEERMTQRLAKRFESKEDRARAREFFIAMYAKPVRNKEASKEGQICVSALNRTVP